MTPLDAAHATVHEYPGGAAALCTRLDMSRQILHNKVNPNCPTNHLTLDDVDRIMGITGDFRILHALAAKHGFVCVPLPEAKDDDSQSIFHLLVSVMGESGDVGRAVDAALADGRITPKEMKSVEKEIYELQQVLQVLQSRMKERATP